MRRPSTPGQRAGLYLAAFAALAALAAAPTAAQDIEAQGSVKAGVDVEFGLLGSVKQNGTPLLTHVPSGFTSSLGLGANALSSSTGNGNIAIGYQALTGSTSSGNVAVGNRALSAPNGGPWNTALGNSSLIYNTAGAYNTAVGGQALAFNTTGYRNTAVGYSALLFNVGGIQNSAFGASALLNNTSGIRNVAVGASSLSSNLTGTRNVACGSGALASNVAGSNNIGLGFNAGSDAGYGVPGDPAHAIFIGNTGAVNDSHLIRIGTLFDNMGDGDPANDVGQNTTYIAGIHNGVLAGGDDHPVCVDNAGQVGACPDSSARFKQDVRDLSGADLALEHLRPVSFRYREGHWGGPEAVHYGLIAEEVAEILPDIVGYDETGRPRRVDYAELTPLLLAALQRQRGEMEDLAQRIGAQDALIRELLARLPPPAPPRDRPGKRGRPPLALDDADRP